MPAGVFELLVKCLLHVTCAVNCEEDLKLGFEDDNWKGGEKDEYSDPDDEFEGLPL